MSDGELRGKVAVVTGGATGIGLAASLAFARAGAAVAVNYSKNAEAASAAVKEIGKLGVGAVAIRADVSNDGEVRAMLARVAKELGGVDILVNNAGWTKRVQPHSDLDGRADDPHDVARPRSRTLDPRQRRGARPDPDGLRRVDRCPLDSDVRANADPAPAHGRRDGRGDLLPRDDGWAHGPDDRGGRRPPGARPDGKRCAALILRPPFRARALPAQRTSGPGRCG